MLEQIQHDVGINQDVQCVILNRVKDLAKINFLEIYFKYPLGL